MSSGRVTIPEYKPLVVGQGRFFNTHVDGYHGANLHARSPCLRGREGGEKVPWDVYVPCLPQRRHRGLDDPPPHPLSSARAQVLQPRLVFGPWVLAFGRRMPRRVLGGSLEDETGRIAHFGAHKVPAVKAFGGLRSG